MVNLREVRVRYETEHGTLTGYGFASIIPMVNWICVIGDIAPDYLSGFFKTLGGILNLPLVPKK
jgi:hypothetical protein